ncbi:MAG: hypothetical protein IJ521_09430 [Schwartzia sp.]|nr:hypothetical protein [Schwartzia sp. (in: firmicutes)]
MKKSLRFVLVAMFLWIGALSASAGPKGGASEEAAMPPVEVVQYFHHKITDRNFELAYDVLTEDYKRLFGSCEDFKNRYTATLRSRPHSFRVLEQTGSSARVSYVVEARDWMDDAHIVEQTFVCETVLKKVNGAWLMDGGKGKATERMELTSRQSAAAVLSSYHDCITAGEMRAAWNLLGSDYQNSFGDFSAFVDGFATTVSSEVHDIVPVADGPGMLTLEYTLTAKDATEETDVVQVFQGMAALEVVPGRGWRILSAENRLVDRYFPPKWQ